MRNIKRFTVSEQIYYILLSLATDQKHGYAILKDVQSLSTGRIRLSTSTLYTALGRLLEQGLIERVPDESPVSPGRPRKSYRLSQSGKIVLDGEVNRLKYMLHAASQYLGVEEP